MMGTLVVKGLRKASSPHHEHCCMCKTDISVQNGVNNALKKHISGKAHKEVAAAKKVNMLNIRDFFQSTRESSTSSITNAPIGNYI